MWYNKSGSLIQTGSLLELFNKPHVQNSLKALVILGSIYTAVPAPGHHENKLAPEENAAVITGHTVTDASRRNNKAVCAILPPPPDEACEEVFNGSPEHGHH